MIPNPVGKTGVAFSLRFRFRFMRTQKSFRKGVGDERTGANLGLEIAFRMSFSKASFTVSRAIPRSVARVRVEGSREELPLNCPRLIRREFDGRAVDAAVRPISISRTISKAMIERRRRFLFRELFPLRCDLMIAAVRLA